MPVIHCKVSVALAQNSVSTLSGWKPDGVAITAESKHVPSCCASFFQASLEVKREDNNTYICPVYLTVQRGPTFVFNAQLRTKLPPAKWILGGVAMILDVGGAA